MTFASGQIVVTTVGTSVSPSALGLLRNSLAGAHPGAVFRPSYGDGSAWGEMASGERLLRLLNDNAIASIVALPGLYGAARIAQYASRALRRAPCTVVTAGTGCAILAALADHQQFSLRYVTGPADSYDDALARFAMDTSHDGIAECIAGLRPQHGGWPTSVVAGDVAELAGLISSPLDPFANSPLLFAEGRNENAESASRAISQILRRTSLTVTGIILGAFPAIAADGLKQIEEEIWDSGVPVARWSGSPLCIEYRTR